ncbi:MAG: hypothetical protein EB015_20360 [Methylocystaceae bacterium]|nr:hypothetical protein [Methylocystaceae bacterium]
MTVMINKGAQEPNKSGRQADGRFAPGNRANPTGRPVGSLNKVTKLAQALLDADADAIFKALINNAKAGDSTAMRLCAERLLPARRDRPLEYQLLPINSGADAAAAMNEILAGVSEGTITPAEGDALARLVESAAKIAELSILEARVAALEEASGK